MRPDKERDNSRIDDIDPCDDAGLAIDGVEVVERPVGDALREGDGERDGVDACVVRPDGITDASAAQVGKLVREREAPKKMRYEWQ